METQRHHGNRCPYELRICNKCDWHTIQDEGHIILDCPSQDLTCVLGSSICLALHPQAVHHALETS
eukprot:1142705-Pelagomonas_calceolata.AAC.1